MLTDEELREIKERHQPGTWRYGGKICDGCSGDNYCMDWPCDAARLLDEVERLRGFLESARYQLTMQHREMERLRYCYVTGLDAATFSENLQKRPAR